MNDFFYYKDKNLFCEGLEIEAIARDVETPFYIYSSNMLRFQFETFKKSFGKKDYLIAYSVKANSNVAILKLLSNLGSGADIVSGGELSRCLFAGISPKNIVFSGVGKSSKEISDAVESGILQFNVESEEELKIIAKISRDKGVSSPVSFRINPDITAGGHVKISTGKKEDKFGISIDNAMYFYSLARNLEGVNIVGIDIHIGSQINSLTPFKEAFIKIRMLYEKLMREGYNILNIDLGGGLGVDQINQIFSPPTISEYINLVKNTFKDIDCKLILEPGRVIASDSGLLISSVLYVKNSEEKKFLIIDAGMNDLMRPALYGSIHPIEVIKEAIPNTKYDIVGPVCESSDTFIKDLNLPILKKGDLLAIKSAGAYGASMSSSYNSRPLAPEVLVSDTKYHTIRKRVDAKEFMTYENIPEWL